MSAKSHTLLTQAVTFMCEYEIGVGGGLGRERGWGVGGVRGCELRGNDVHFCLSVKTYVHVDETLKRQAWVGSLNLQIKSGNVAMESE